LAGWSHAGDDYGTSELALDGQPDAVALPGDLIYECGSPPAFTSPVGYHGSWGWLNGISYVPILPTAASRATARKLS
jgi:hypothetical protein